MQLWSIEQALTLIPAIGVMVLLGILARKKLLHKPVEERLFPLQLISIALLVLEAGKQFVSICHGYSLYHLPFHFCSLYLFMLPAMSFYQGKHSKVVRSVGFSICGALFITMLIYPSLIYSGENVRLFFSDYLSFHTVLFHNLVMLAWVLMAATQIHIPYGKGEGKALALFTLGFCVVAATLSQLLQTNFANFYSCNVPPVEDFRLYLQSVIGYWPAQLIYIVGLSAFTIVFVQVFGKLGQLVLPKKKANV